MVTSSVPVALAGDVKVPATDHDNPSMPTGLANENAPPEMVPKKVPPPAKPPVTKHADPDPATTGFYEKVPSLGPRPSLPIWRIAPRW